MRTAIIQKRRERKLSQEDAAKVFGISRVHYSGVETGNRNPSIELAIAIHTKWDIPLEKILIKK